jgi:hypothetical protein
MLRLLASLAGSALAAEKATPSNDKTRRIMIILIAREQSCRPTGARNVRKEGEDLTWHLLQKPERVFERTAAQRVNPILPLT